MGVCLSCNKKSEPRETIEEEDKKKNNVPSPSPSILHKPTSSFPSTAPPPADHPSATSSKPKTSKTATSTPRSSSPSSQKKKKKTEGVLPLAEISICNQQYGAEAAEGGKEGTTTKKKKNENRGVMEGCGMVRTSSCTKEEVESILIQCSRLSRSSSGKSSNENNPLSQRGSSINNKAGNGGGGSVSSALKKQSGSKRNYSEAASDEIGVNEEEEEQQQQLNSSSKPKETQQSVERSRHSRNPSSEMGGVVEFYYKRSSSKEKLASDHSGTRSASGSRGGSGESKRRVSRSPGKRSGTPEAASSTTQEHKSRSTTRSVAVPVMVPASSSTKPVGKKMSSRAAASRSQSPATRHPSSATGSSNADGAPSAAPLISRSSSRRTEISPHRRPTTPQDENKEKERGEISISDKTAAIRGVNNNDRPRSARSRPRSRSNSLDGIGGLLNSRVTKPSEEEKAAAAAAAAAAIVQDIIISSHRNANSKPSETLNSSSTTPIQLPACVSKACSIVEAVADLNSNSFKSLKDSKAAANSYSNSASDEVLRHVLDSGVNNKYVCARRRDVTPTPNSDQFTPRSRSDDGPESSAGSNTFININGSSSSWEPTSSDSAECWVDGPLFQKFVMNEGHSSTSTYNVLPSSHSQSREIEEEEEEKRWCSEEMNAKQRNSGSGGGGLVPVMTLSKNVKKKEGGAA